MLQLYYWTTPNGHKITIFLEEAEICYEICPINIGKGEQFQESFLKIAPNNRIPAIVDDEPHVGDKPMTLFESGVILEYLADKTGKFLPKKEDPARYETLQWLYWQMGGLGPMAGQNHHFTGYAPEKIPYAIERYQRETTRLYGVLDKSLSSREFVAGSEYSIADMAIYPWIVPYKNQGQDLNDFKNLKRWFEQIAERPGVKKAYERAKTVNTQTKLDAKAAKILFGCDVSKDYEKNTV